MSVVIPCYEQAHFLPQALESVAKQTLQPLEVIVIDDGSPTQELAIQEVCMHYDRQRLTLRRVRVTNRGLPSARNTGLMLARGDWFLPLDADDWLREDYLEKTVPLTVNADVVLTGIQEHGDPPRNQAYRPGFDRDWRQVTADLILREHNRFFYCSLIRTELLRKVGGYNAKMSEGLEDGDLWVDLLRWSARFAACEEPLFQYRTSTTGMLQSIHRNGGYQRMVEEMRRHHHAQR